MGVLIPADFDTRTIPNITERRVVENLRDRLTDSWRIIPRVDIATPRRPYEVDVLIFHEKYGIAGIEVKGGQLRIEQGEWVQGSHRLDVSPPRQSQNACFELRNILRDKHSSLYQLRIESAVALPDCNEIGVDPLEAQRPQLLFQEDFEHLGRDLAAATGAVAVLGKADGLAHVVTLQGETENL